ncbi:uncharacterized protein NECHADRAFT_80963 [Fusarium vanettenii 77-13-4]|uniref:HpcH/HpaI aldolase/citrate lyase domain-containing protein n=1 Tax=Fusarium vanettenii (strain ATCC MYA-4622 / CBS 123669 / FGSC 9596 / NRRL 45880 / 77-13-4) TaxID=660122 RepID=C7YT63_FUSV7|nr:uncharacterized protein NECHADRAFT_80963 [Fusarium vanettenii 77-13-4]EEU45769.1 hypothetical protein NECHADRAFT_80963 [Fusarium vanettenii 77-13-4]
MQASNRLKSTFAQGKQTFGAWQMLPGANISRLLARSGVDWVLIDCEHGNIDDGAMHDSVPAVAALGVSPLVRVADMQGWMVKRALDSGAHGLYQANDALVTIIQIETHEALESVEEIVAVDGIDALFIGPFDLGNNLGYPIQKGIIGPVLKEALARILAATRRAGKKCGIYCKDAQKTREFAAQGYDMLVAATDYMALQAAVNGEVSLAKGEQAGKGTW